MESASCTNGFSKLNSPAHRYLGLRFEPHLAMRPARLEARMDSLLSFPVGLFHPLQTCRFIPTLVAVGTTIADRPPHRSVRARLRTRLLPRMSGGETSIRIRMQNAGLWNPPVQDGEQTPPTHLGALTAAN